MEQYQIELMWNREFHFVEYGKPLSSLDEARKLRDTLLNMGDGERVKKCRIKNNNTGEYVL